MVIYRKDKKMWKLKNMLFIMVALLSIFLFIGKTSTKEVTIEDLCDNYLQYLDENEVFYYF